MGKYIVALLVLISWFQGSAQNEDFNKWQFSIGGGLALPVSSFKNTDVQNSISIRDSDVLVFEFFDKEGNGYAQPGYFISASVGRVFLKHLEVSFNFDYTKNDVSVEEINSHYDATMDAPYYHVFSQDPYKVNKQFVGFGYFKKNNNWKFCISSLFGLGNMNFPVYDLQVIKDESWGGDANTVSLHFQHTKEQPTLHSFTFGLSGEVGLYVYKSIFLEFHAKYMSADFEYEIEPKSIGIDPRPRQDVVNYRLVDLGINIGVSF